MRGCGRWQTHCGYTLRQSRPWPAIARRIPPEARSIPARTWSGEAGKREERECIGTIWPSVRPFLPTCGCTWGSSGCLFWEIDRKRVLCFDIMAGPDEEDPFSDLRHTFEGDDRLDDSPVPSSTRASAAALPRSTSTAPPPLPARRLAPVDRVSSNPLPRSQDDPFHEPPEPRLPHGLPEEKLEFFRVVLKQKQETLARARALFAEREAEARSLTEAVNSVRAQMDSALAELEREQQRSQQVEVRVTQLQAELQASDQDRRDSSAALAEVEAQVVAMTEAAKAEQSSRGLLGKEFMDAQEALSKTQHELSELAAEKSELAGNLEATQELYQAVTSENERLSSQLERSTEEIGTLAAERDAAIAQRNLAHQQLNDAKARLADLEKSNAAALQKSHSAERWVAEANEKATAAERTAVEAQKKIG